jgi:hypothetical protein
MAGRAIENGAPFPEQLERALERFFDIGPNLFVNGRRCLFRVLPFVRRR